METKETRIAAQIAQLWKTLPSNGVGTVRLNQAVRRLKDGMPYQEVVERAHADEAQSRDMWLDKAMLPWCKRHGLSLEQGLSVVFNDHAYNPDNPERDQVILRDLMWNGQGQDFAVYLQRQMALDAATNETSEPTPMMTSREEVYRWTAMSERHPGKNQNVVFQIRSENGYAGKQWVSKVDEIGWANDFDGYHKPLKASDALCTKKPLTTVSATHWFPIADYTV